MIIQAPQKNKTSPLKRDHLTISKRKFHLPTINFRGYGWWFRNPAFTGKSCHYLQGFNTSQVVSRISSINSRLVFRGIDPNQNPPTSGSSPVCFSSIAALRRASSITCAISLYSWVPKTPGCMWDLSLILYPSSPKKTQFGVMFHQILLVKGSLDAKLPSYELLNMLKETDQKSSRFVK